jgi:hypothetical protein
MANKSLNYLIIPLNNKGEIVYCKIDQEDVGLVTKYGWSVSNGYARAEVAERTLSMHRLVLGLPPGRYPEVDHINRDKLDNRKGNLRLATRGQNNSNAVRKKGKNKYRGVYQVSRNSFKALLSSGSKRLQLGSYKTAEEAAVAYNQAARQHHGDFAVLNEVPEIKE